MADRDDASPAGDGDLDRVSSDDETETVKGDDNHDEGIAEMLEEEMQAPATPVPLGNGLVSNRYREILRDQLDDVSDDSSSEAGVAPRRLASPVDSMLSGPDDSPSVQVIESSRT